MMVMMVMMIMMAGWTIDLSLLYVCRVFFRRDGGQRVEDWTAYRGGGRRAGCLVDAAGLIDARPRLPFQFGAPVSSIKSGLRWSNGPDWISLLSLVNSMELEDALNAEGHEYPTHQKLIPADIWEASALLAPMPSNAPHLGIA